MPFDPLPPRARYNLAALVKAQRPGARKRSIILRPIEPTQALASDLYRACYRPLIAKIEATMPAILSAYSSALTVRDGFADASDPQSVTNSLGDDLRNMVLALIPALRLWTARTEKWHRAKWRSAVLSASGVDLDTMLIGSPQPASVQDTINWNVALIRYVGDQARARISSAVFAALHARKPAADLAKDLRGIVGMSRRRSLLIASDQLGKLSSALDRERMAEAGISEFKYRHSGKLHPRKWHRARDGKLYDLKTGKEIGGDDAIAADDMPGIPPYCGCRKQAVVRFT